MTKCRKVLIVALLFIVLCVAFVVPTLAYTGSIGTSQVDYYYYYHAYAPDYRLSGMNGAYQTAYSTSGPTTVECIVTLDDVFVTNDYEIESGSDEQVETFQQTAVLTQYADDVGNSIQPIEIRRTITFGVHNTFDDMIGVYTYGGNNTKRWMSAPEANGVNNPDMFGGARYVWNEVIFDKTSSSLYDELYIIEYTFDEGIYTDYLGVDISADIILADQDGHSYSQHVVISKEYEPVLGYEFIDNDRNSTRITCTLRNVLDVLDSYCVENYGQSIYRRNETCFVSDLAVGVRCFDELGRLPAGYSATVNDVDVEEICSLKMGRPNMSEAYIKWYNETVATLTDFDFGEFVSRTIHGITSAEIFHVGDFVVSMGAILGIGVALAVLSFFLKRYAGG